MPEPRSKFLVKMLERMYASMSAGPALNCRPHTSRQRVDLTHVSRLDGATGQAVLRALLGEDATAKLVSRRARPAERPGLSDEALSPEERAARRAWDEQQGLLHKLRVIAEDARAYEQETGLHALNIGFPLLQLPPGQLASVRHGASKRVLAPICFIPVELVVKSGRVQSVELGCAAEGVDRVVPNAALLAWIEQQTGTRFEDLFADEEGTAPWREINELVALVCKALHLPEPAALSEHTAVLPAPRTDDEDGREARILPAAVLGLYPLTNQNLMRDLEAMANGEPLSGPVESFVRVNVSIAGPGHEVPDQTLAGRRDFAADRLVSYADPCQARAVQLARSSKGLVIHGPPGTGKSQTITNVIGDHLARRERVLFVCDKRTALDVVHYRLHHLGLGNLCAVVHDAQRDQRELYRSIREQLDGLPESKTNPAAVAELDAVNDEISQIHRLLSQHERALSERPSVTEPSFHELVGQWYATDVPEELAVTRRLDEPRLAALPPFEKDIREILERSARESYSTNPWRGVLAIDLKTYMGRPQQEWRTSLDELADAARRVDAADVAGVIPFAAEGDVAREAAARSSLAERVQDLLQRVGPAAVARWAMQEPAALHKAQEQIRSVEPQRALVAARPPDPALSLVLKSELPPLSLLTLWIGALLSYLQIAGKWYRFLFFRRRRQALDVLQRFGLPLGAATLDRALAFLEGIRALQVLRDCHARLLPAAPEGNPAPEDEDLPQSLGDHGALLSLLDELSTSSDLAHCAKEIRARLSDPAQHASLLEGLRRSAARGPAIAAVEERLSASGLFTVELRQKLSAEMRRGGKVGLFCSGLRDRAASIEGIIRIERGLAAMPGALAAAVQSLCARSAPPTEGWCVVRKAVIEGEIVRRLQAAPQLQEVDGERLRAYHEHFHALDEHKRDLVREAILHTWTGRQRKRLLASTGTRLGIAGTELRRRLTLQGKRAMRVRQVIASGASIEGGDPLFDMRPVWMASPDTVAQLFPRAPLFDVVIFDEASQCRLEEALPVLLRARRVVIAGDPKQLPPTRFFESALVQSQESEAETDQDLFEEQQSDVEDLLAAALNLEIEQCYLDVHYRSRNAALIEFSNQSFYEDRLQPIPGHPKNRAQSVPLRLIHATGVYDKRANLKEAQKVVEIVRELLDREQPPSIGIACFNLTQREAILDALDEAAATDPAFAARLASARTRQGAASFEGLFVKNLENVQGDERDHMIISTTYGPDPRGRFYRRFGPLGKAGGGRRLNVLVTRARDEIHLVTSIPADQYRNLPPLQPDQTPNGAWLLFSYLSYAEQVARSFTEEADRLALARVAPEPKVRVRETSRGSRFVEALAGQMVASGRSTDVHWGNDGFCVDLALHHPSRPEDVTIGVLCDWTRFEKTVDPVEWDLFRTMVLESQGWQLLRLWTPHVFRDPAAAVAGIVKEAEAFVAAEQPELPQLSAPSPQAAPALMN